MYLCNDNKEDRMLTGKSLTRNRDEIRRFGRLASHRIDIPILSQLVKSAIKWE